ncbi:MAG: hypothetical protein QM736_11095 [Vicinamibacterales bacterium]
MTNDLPTPDDVVEQLSARRVDALNTLEMLRAQRANVVEESSKFENPQAVLEYLDFFIPSFEEVVAALDRVSDEIVVRVTRAHIDLLRQIAANCRTEQRRCLVFRDKCINRPLPHEAMRPLLNDISVTTRDQLTAFFDLNSAAARLELIINTTGAEEPDKRVMGRRQLFTNLFKLPRG